MRWNISMFLVNFEPINMSKRMGGHFSPQLGGSFFILWHRGIQLVPFAQRSSGVA